MDLAPADENLPQKTLGEMVEELSRNLSVSLFNDRRFWSVLDFTARTFTHINAGEMNSNGLSPMFRLYGPSIDTNTLTSISS